MSTRAASAAKASVVDPRAADHTRSGSLRAAATVCREARTREELAEHFRVRHVVFVLEQSVFVGSDRDQHDEDGSAIHLVGYCDGIIAGSVRLYELDRSTGIWQGDRLAVLPPYRVGGLGAPLVRCAVAIAGARGGRTMVAHIQPPKVTFFTRLGWSSEGEPEIYVGLAHQRMRISLPAPDVGAAIARSLAAGRPA
ncbi:MAG TPA: MSMEG_0567/Sll0786 family nitrogen starvation N-acetyltransferase [Jiangellaceae bacterium]|nr:MSMEG_0567/Sll0786 family nitrogen starvation N-acetyltransferase [Jiangellaceae bacterium]